MKKQAAPATALAPLAQTLPALQAGIPEEQWAGLNAEFRNDLEWQIRRQKGERNASRIVIGMFSAVSVPVVLLGGPLGLCIVGGPLLMTAAFGVKEQKKLNSLIGDEIADRQGFARRKFRQAQQAAYAAQKRLVVEAAENHLARGGLLGPEDAAWLGTLDPAAIEGATNQLAITVLQIRRMLAHMRCASYRSDGSREIGPPATLAGLKLMGDFEPHRDFLRGKLRAEDTRLAEDDLPVLQDPELAAPLRAKPGLLAAMRDFVNPLSGFRLRRDFEKAELPRFRPVEIPALAPVADFAEALAFYESKNPPLDLPALRGWKGGARKSLPGPLRPL
jgi:hypothetical protein